MHKGICDGCHKKTWVNNATLREAHIGWFCAECFEVVEHDINRPPRTSSGSGLNHNDPGFDNAVRVMEDRE